VPGPASELFQKGQFSLPKGASVILGFNSGDTLQGPPWFERGALTVSNMSLHTYEHRVNDFFPRVGDTVLALYPWTKTAGYSGRQYLNMNADACVKCPMQMLASQLAKAGHYVYVYYYTYNPVNGSFYGFAGHASEVSAVFGTNPVTEYWKYCKWHWKQLPAGSDSSGSSGSGSGSGSGVWHDGVWYEICGKQAQDRLALGPDSYYWWNLQFAIDPAISKDMQSFWTSFAKNGKPGMNSQPKWEPFFTQSSHSFTTEQLERGQVMQFGPRAGKAGMVELSPVMSLRCDMWQDSNSGIANKMDTWRFCEG